MTEPAHSRNLPYLLNLLLSLKGTAAGEDVRAEILERFGGFSNDLAYFSMPKIRADGSERVPDEHDTARLLGVEIQYEPDNERKA